MKTLKKLLGIIVEYSCEISIVMLFALATVFLMKGAYFDALHVFCFAFMASVAVMFAKEYYDLKQRYINVWDTLAEWSRLADTYGRELVIKMSKEDDGELSMTSSMDRKIPHMLPSEALYGFAAWLSCREEVTVISSQHNPSVLADLVSTFAIANGLADPRNDHYPANIVRMGEYKNQGKADVSKGVTA